MSLPAFSFTDRAVPVLEIGVGDSRVATTGGLWDSARWDNPAALWAGDEPYWRDVSCETYTVECEYGRRASTDRFVAGALTVVVRNRDGWADPHHTDDISTLSMRPGRALRCGMHHRTLGYRPLFYGVIDAVTPMYEPNRTDSVQLDVIDMLGEINRTKVDGSDTPLGAGDTVDTRINRILDRAGWPTSKRDIARSGVTCVADELAGQVADQLSTAAESANGVVFGSLDGDITFRHDTWQMFDPATPPDATVGNTPGDVCPTRWERPFDRADISTRVIIGRDVDTAVVVDDTTGMVLYGVEPLQRTDLWTESNATLARFGAMLLATRGPDTAPRIRSVSFDAAHDDSVVDLLCGLDVYRPSRWRCRHTTPTGRLVFDDQYLVTGVAHRFDVNSWRADVNLDVAAPYATTGEYWDMAYWDRARWITPAATELAALLAEVRT